MKDPQSFRFAQTDGMVYIPFLANYKNEIQTRNVFTTPNVLEQDCCSVQNEYISISNIIHLNTLFSSILNVISVV